MSVMVISFWLLKVESSKKNLTETLNSTKKDFDSVLAKLAKRADNEVECCRDNCESYRGTLAVADTGEPCLPWSKSVSKYNKRNFPKFGLDSNYCRNPSNHYNAWCYIEKKNSYGKWKWRNCNMKSCPDITCCYDATCASYRGNLAVAKTGEACLPWSKSVTEYNPKDSPNKGLDSNYCRNPSDHTNAWCYVEKIGKNGKPEWRNCNMKKCPGLAKDVRLVNGGKIGGSSGRVEVLVEGEWGTVCDDGLIEETPMFVYIYDNGRNVARIVCKSLGYNAGEPILTPEHNRGTGKIAMRELECWNNEASLLDCSFNNYEYCGHYEDLSVSCS